MIKKTIAYTDFKGETRNEDYYFNLSKAELMEMELSQEGGISEYMQKIIKAQQTPELIALFKRLLLESYGVISPDGREFLKTDENGKPLSIRFSQSAAYSTVFMELATNADAATAFFNGVLPDMSDINPTKQEPIVVSSNN